MFNNKYEILNSADKCVLCHFVRLNAYYWKLIFRWNLISCSCEYIYYRYRHLLCTCELFLWASKSVEMSVWFYKYYIHVVHGIHANYSFEPELSKLLFDLNLIIRIHGFAKLMFAVNVTTQMFRKQIRSIFF